MENNRYAPLYDEENGYVVSDEEYVVSHGPNNEPVTSTQLHEVLLEMMLEIDRVCRLNNILVLNLF